MLDAVSGDTPLTSDNEAVAATVAVLRLLGGTAGRKYKVVNHITTDETPAQEDDRSFKIRVKER